MTLKGKFWQVSLFVLMGWGFLVSPQETSPHQDMPPPQPTVEVKTLLDEARAHLDAKRTDDALKTLEHALKLAQEKSDWVGQGYVYREQAKLNSAQALELWQKAEEAFAKAGDRVGQVEALLSQAVLLYRNEKEQSERLVAQALELASKEQQRPLAMANLLHERGVDFFRANELATTEQIWIGALHLRKQFVPDTKIVVDTLNNLGIVAINRGNLRQAGAYLSEALSIIINIAPESLEEANCRLNLGVVATRLGNLGQAEELFERALVLFERHQPESTNVVRVISNLGVIAHEKGNLLKAEMYYQRGLKLLDRIDPNSPLLASLYENLGVIYADRHDWVQAERSLKRALALRQSTAPDSIGVAGSLSNLGALFADQGDWAQSEYYHKQALALFERLAPNSLDVAISLNNLGSVALMQGKLTEAEVYLPRAVSLFEALAPQSSAMGVCLSSLGSLCIEKQEFEKAEQYHSRALSLREQIAPESLDVARSLNNLGVVAYARANLTQAEEYHKRALAIRERIAPDSIETALSLTHLAQIAMERHDWQTAQQYLRRAIEIMETQRKQIPNPESRLNFTRRYSDPYGVYVQVLLGTDQPALAFETLERARARTLVELISEREWRIAPDVPDDLRQRQQQLDARRSRAYRQLQQATEAETTRWREELKSISAEQRALNADLRRASPRYAQLQFPEPLSLQQIQASLDEGTLLATYVLGEKQSWPITATRQSLRVYPLNRSEREVRRLVLEYRALLMERDSLNRPKSDIKTIGEKGKALYDLLLQPAQAEWQGAKRLLVIADGVLNRLPFGALVVQAGDKPTYLIEKLPIHTVPSIGTYRLVRSYLREREWAYTLLAVGDPAYPELSTQSGEKTESLQKRGLRLQRLPETRKEVEALAQLYGSGARVIVDKEATVSAVLSDIPKSRVVHLACHGLLDNQDPLGSALVFTPSGDDDGFLRAYQVLGGVPLGTDLVVLSACETGRGAEIKHEGVVGLSWAFLGAGARSVVVSLWEVKDTSTAELMVSFHRHLREGKSKDEALRSAQLGLIRSQQHAHPYHWSGFVLMGDYR